MKKRNMIAADLRSAKYRKRVVQDKTRYTRKLKHKQTFNPRPSRRGFDFGGLMTRRFGCLSAFRGRGLVIGCCECHAGKYIECAH